MEIWLAVLLIFLVVNFVKTKTGLVKNLIVALCALMMLGACSPGNNETPAPKIFKQQRDALDKAKAVEPAQQQQDEAQRKASEY
jgi:protein involved in sex pheromone biosynthesis